MVKFNKDSMTHENLSMMDSVTTKYGKTTVITISKPLAIILVIVFILCLIVTGILVYSFASSVCDQINQPNNTILTKSSGDNNITSDIFVTSTTAVVDYFTSTEYTEISSTVSSYNMDLKVNRQFRLTKNILPDKYTLHLVPILEENNFTFQGNVRILVNVTLPNTNQIVLHSDNLEIVSVSVTDKLNNTVSIRDVRLRKKEQFLIIDLDENLGIEQYVISIVFKGVLNNSLEGFYRSSYEENGIVRWIAATQFQATDARKAFPCFDEPSFKAKFQINIARPMHMTSISNMPKSHSTKTVTDLPNYVWDHYQETYPMSTYLVAFVISDFTNISNGNFSIWARPSALSQAQYSLKIAPIILKYYERFFGINYPLPKLDMVAIPDFSAGAMENWGLITYRESVLLYEKGVSTRASLEKIAHVVAHELAHQWFGNLVTPVWWEDLWLNEGFATYVEYLGAYAVGPKWKDPDLFIVIELQSSLEMDAMKSSHPISVKVNDPEEVDDIFDSISYSKGASVIRMMEQFLTREVFLKGINKYLKYREYGNAEQDYLWSTLTQQAHEDGVLDKNITINDIMNTWTLQTGFPVVLASRVVNSTMINVSQERFLLSHETRSENTLWWIPITYTSNSGDEAAMKFWMTKEPQITFEDKSLTKESDWFLININQTGYYRVNYDQKNWINLINQMQNNGHVFLDPKNRAQIMDDALNLALAGYISYDIALNATMYLVNEREYVPWKAALNNLEFLYSMFVRSGHFDKYKMYMMTLVKDFYEEMGFKELPKDDPTLLLTRTDIVREACRFGWRSCVIRAVQQFQNWRNSANPDKENLISPDLKETVYCTAIGDGGQEEWDFAWDRYLNANVANEKEILLAALACSKEIWILTRYLEWSITENSGIRKHDTGRVFAAVSRNPVGHDLVYRFLKSNWQRIKDYLGSSAMYMGSIIKSSTAELNTKEEIDDLRHFLQFHQQQLGITVRTAQQLIEQVDANLKWMKNYFQDVLNWLNSTLIQKHSLA